MPPIIWIVFVSLLPAVVLAPLAVADDYQRDPGGHEVQVLTFEWKDVRRDREVPVRIYVPKDRGPYPVVIFSHGLGGSRDGYSYLGRHWATHGYVSVHLQHRGSDQAVWQGQTDVMAALRKTVADPQSSINRPLDVTFAIDQLQKLNAEESPLKGKLDLQRIGMAGHSFGGYTTLAIIGQRFFPLGRETTAADRRVKAAISMSAPVPRKKEDLARSFDAIVVPCLHMTGTLDDSPIGDTKASDRRAAFDHISKADQLLVIFKDGDHMIFSGRAGVGARAGNVPGFGGDPKKDAQFQALIRQSTTVFWDAYLRGDEKAKIWLTGAGFQDTLASDGAVEVKRVR